MPLTVKCPTCEGKGYVMGIDKRYPQDGNVALGCPDCHFRGTLTLSERPEQTCPDENEL